MTAVLIICLGVLFVLWSTYNNDSKEGWAVKSYAEGLQTVKAGLSKSLTKAEFNQVMEPINNILNDIEDRKLVDIENSLKAQDACVETVFKRLEAIETRQKMFDRRLAGTKRELSVNFGKPVPVEIVNAPPKPKKAGK